ncbi:MAG: hypothetical protein IJ849_07275 [Selenomonadaceae bacterium]|nr:hypothetical protein [Selenomonadaceae bacterium]
MAELNLYGCKLTVTDEMMDEYKHLTYILNLASTMGTDVVKEYNACGSLRSATMRLLAIRDKHYPKVAKFLLDSMRESDIVGYDYSVEDFLADAYPHCHKIVDVHKELSQVYEKLTNEKLEAEAYRDYRKASRTRMVGGGFGVSGALQGMALAGTVNMATGAVHSLFNLFDGAITNSSISSQMDEVYRAGQADIRAAVCNDVVNMLFVSYDIMSYTPFYGVNDRKTNNIKKAIDGGEVPQSKLPMQVLKVLTSRVYDDNMYFWVYDLLGDPKGELAAFARFFHKEDVADRLSYMDNGKALFGDEWGKIEEDNKMSSFFPLLVAAPQLSVKEAIADAYHHLVKDDMKKYLFLVDEVGFDKAFADFKASLRKKGTILKESIAYYLVFKASEDGYLAMSEDWLVTNNTEHFVTIWKDNPIITYEDTGFFSEDYYIRINAEKTIACTCTHDAGYTFLEIARLVEAKYKYKLGIKPPTEPDAASLLNEKNLNAPPATAKFTREIVTKLIYELYDKGHFAFRSRVYYVTDDKADKKFANATSSFAKLAAGELPIVLYDSTVFGSSKDGLLMSTRGIHQRTMYEDPQFFPYERVLSITALSEKGKVGDNIYINGKKINAVGIDDTEKFVAMMKFVMNYLAEAAKFLPPEQKELPPALAPANVQSEPPKPAKQENENKRNESVYFVNYGKISQGAAELLKVLNDDKRFRFSSHVYYYRDDSRIKKMFAQAIDKYAKLSEEESPLVLYTPTSGNDGSKGFLLSTHGIYEYHEPTSSFVYYNAIKYLGIVDVNGNREIFVNDTQLASMYVDKDKLLDMMKFVIDYLAKASNNPVESQTVTGEKDNSAENKVVVSGKDFDYRAIDKDTIASLRTVLQKCGKFDFSGSTFASGLYIDTEQGKGKKKLAGAMKSYAKLLPDELPIIVYDDTFFGSADNGFLLTSRGIHWKNFLADAVFLTYGKITGAESKVPEGKKKSELFVNGKKINTVGIKDKEKGVELIRCVIDYLADAAKSKA